MESSECKATRHNAGKPKWSLVDFKAFENMVEVLSYGSGKYGRDNWRQGLPVEEICESMLRHIFAYLAGEKIDQESGLSHVGHIQANAMFLGYFSEKFVRL